MESSMQTGILEAMIPIVLFVAIAVVLCVYFYLRHRTSQSVQDTVRAAIEQGQQLTPEILERIGQAPQRAKSGNSDLRRGVILITVGLGILAFMELSGNFKPLAGLAVGSLPVLIGIAYLGLWRFDKSE
ncbi:MAG: DUF6249 domain-containing protein [Gammaproteobacteria bacterium]|nr:DUF6249 domain-containing protein [Gammaproteobacteria bacterium]MDE0225160.1 DUF6249 domain-containing protein [Gammaproteobacteria bacterium]